MPHKTDLNLSSKDIQGLTSADALAAFFTTLGYDTAARQPLTPESIGLSGEAAAPIRAIEVLAEDDEGFFRVVFVRLRSLTAKSRNDLARVLGRTNVDHLLVLADDFETLEFVLLEKRRREARGPADAQRIQVVPLSVAVPRKAVGNRQLRTVRRFTWTGRDGLEQFDKLRSVFDAAAFSEDYFSNRALFADHYLLTRLRDDEAWRDNLTTAFQQVRELLADARRRWLNKGEPTVREQLFEPIFKLLGFEVTVNKAPGDEPTKPDYLLAGPSGKTAAFVYAWDRWLDGPDFNLDPLTPAENPGACVVSALDEGAADWIIMTNGRQWRLYSRHAHSRATNFYEVDLAEALVASGDTDPNEAFRYWWLFFRAAAFAQASGRAQGCWLDAVAEGSRDYAKELGERLKQRIFETIFPHLAQGFLDDRRGRLAGRKPPTEQELLDMFEATLTLLYRLLFLLYAESRDLLPIREAPYRAASLTKLKEEIAERGGIAETEVEARLNKAFSAKETTLYDRLLRLCSAMDQGDPSLNVPIYNGGLFQSPAGTEEADDTAGDDFELRARRIARYLAEHKVPDRHLALAIDRLSRDPDDKTFTLVFIDYKSLEVRHLGSIYEGLLEFKLRVAEEDLTTQTEKGAEKFIPLTAVKSKRGRRLEVVVEQGAVYLSNDKSERKASGSYYTPDPIVEYIVEHTVGPVLAEKLESLRGELRQVRKTFDQEQAKLRVPPLPEAVRNGTYSEREFAGEKTYEAHRDLVERLFDFRTLDPAMGSGHFLVEAVDFITDRLLTFLNQFPVNPVGFMLDRTRRNIRTALHDQGVEVDPDKLTEVNLLKRHVLKRCIYGVDLNPMAVELAKVSLWLDAFTIGAPLSFLDHHLRPGNSLIGATFKNLKFVAARRPLLKIDDEQLKAAIREVIKIAGLADATAAEVKESESLYAGARRRLSGYSTVFDLLVAEYFGIDGAADLISEGDSLSLASKQAFLASLHDARERRLVEEVEELSRRKDLLFFHWELEFPEVFHDFTDADRRTLKHKNDIAPGSAGFDAVVGNPPYVRMELIKPVKPFLKPTFACHAERADLFIYFYELAVRLLRGGGRSAYIASSTWTKTKAGEPLRAFLKQSATIDSFLDFGDLPVFADATTYPAIMVVENKLPEPDHLVAGAVVPDLEDLDLSRVLQSRRIDVPQAGLEASGWSFEDRRIARLRQKIREAGVPLKEYCGSPLRGIVSGLNEAFVVDTPTYERLVAEDRRSKEILKPFLEGKDLKPWRYEWRGLYLIYTHHGIEIDRYPAIKRHLATYRRRLEQRATSDNHDWYELQQPQLAYSERFSESKIFYPHFCVMPEFALDDRGFYGNDKTYCIPNQGMYLLGLLNSDVLWFMIRHMAASKRGGWSELRVQYMDTLPIIEAPKNDRNAIERLAEKLSQESVKDRMSVEAELNERVAELYGLTAEERELIRRGAPQTPAAAADGDDEE